MTVIKGKPSWSDPSASAEELKEWAKREPRTYLNPSMSLKDLINGAHKYPWYIAANPVVPLLQLEDPVAFQRLHVALRHGWREPAGLPLLSEKSRRLYLVDCAEHALPIYERAYPRDKRLREALQAARQFALGRCSSHELSTAHFIVAKIVEELNPPHPAPYRPTPAYYEARAVLCATAPEMGVQDVINGTGVAVWATQEAYGFEETLDWQLGRVLHYISLEHPELFPPTTIGAKKSKAKKAHPASVAGKPDWSNPSLPGDQLVALAKEDPRAYTHPNMPPEALLTGARTYPWFVVNNPVVPLLMLEDPATYAKLDQALIDGWRDVGVRSLSVHGQRLYACDCVDRVLPLYESRYPKNTALRDAISISRRFAVGTATPAELQAAEKVVHMAYKKAVSDAKKESSDKARAQAEKEGQTKSEIETAVYYAGLSYESTAASVAWATYFAVMSAASWAKFLGAKRSLAAITAADQAADAVLDSRSSYHGKHSAASAERRWQADRAMEYVTREHPEYDLTTTIGAKKLKGNPSAPETFTLSPSELTPSQFVKELRTNVELTVARLGDLLENARVSSRTMQNGLVALRENPAFSLLCLEDPARVKFILYFFEVQREDEKFLLYGVDVDRENATNPRGDHESPTVLLLDRATAVSEFIDRFGHTSRLDAALEGLIEDLCGYSKRSRFFWEKKIEVQKKNGGQLFELMQNDKSWMDQNMAEVSGKKTKIGMRWDDSFEAHLREAQDPMTTPHQFIPLLNKYPGGSPSSSDQAKRNRLIEEAVAQNPNVPTYILLYLAGVTDYGAVVQMVAQNPIWDMIYLENPRFLLEFLPVKRWNRSQMVSLIYEGLVKILKRNPDWSGYMGGITARAVVPLDYEMIAYGNGAHAILPTGHGGEFQVWPSFEQMAEYYAGISASASWAKRLSMASAIQKIREMLHPELKKKRRSRGSIK